MLIESEVTILYKEVHIARQMIGHPRGLAVFARPTSFADNCSISPNRAKK
jgi:hypothetical protein